MIKKTTPVKTLPKQPAPGFTAKQFMEKLKTLQSQAELEKIKRYFKTGEGEYGAGDEFIGVRMGEVFALAKAYMHMGLAEIEKLLESPIHEARTGAVSIMDFQARDKKTPDSRKKELFELYMNRHDRINNWDLVDRSAPYVVGGYLFDKPRAVLYKLAKSKNTWERRTAIVATYFFIRQGDTADTFKIAALLLSDKNDIIHKATGSWLREAGKRDKDGLLHFLDTHAARMPRVALRYATGHLSKQEKVHYMGLER